VRLLILLRVMRGVKCDEAIERSPGKQTGDEGESEEGKEGGGGEQRGSRSRHIVKC
jgi:hypothetical protein